MYNYIFFNNRFRTLLVAFLFVVLSAGSLSAHWSTRGPYGGSVSCFTQLDTIVFLGSPYGGVYRATNTQLSTWVYRNYLGLGSSHITALTSIGKRVVAATADSGIYISDDLGVHWSLSNNGLTNRNTTALVNSNGKLYAGTTNGGVFSSTDSGATWTSVGITSSTKTVTSFLAIARDTIVAGTAGDGVFGTLAGGAFWISLNVGLPDSNITALAFSGLSLFASTPTGVVKGSAVTFTWAGFTTGLGNTNVHSLFVNGDTIYAGTNSGVYQSPVATIGWSPAGTSTDVVKALIVSSGKILAGTTQRGVLRSTLGNVTWAQANQGFNNLIHYAAAAKDSFVVTSNEKGVFVCRNFVTSAVYGRSNNGLTDSLLVTSLVIANGKIYAGTIGGGVYACNADSGATWSTINTGLTNLIITKLIASSTQLYAATADGHIFKTALNTINWSDYSTGLPANTPIAGLANKGDTVVIAAGTNGVYSNLGSGVVWLSANLNKTTTSIAVMGNEVFAATADSGVYKISLGGPAWKAANTGINTLNIQAIAAIDQYLVIGYKGGAQASCNGAKTWHTFGTFEYIPNYSDILGFTHITPRLYALTPGHGLLGNGKNELPEATPDTLQAIQGDDTVCAGSSFALQVPESEEGTSYTWTYPSGWSGVAVDRITTITTNANSGTVSVTAHNGCGSSPVQTLDVTIVTCTDIDDITEPNISIYPNPFTDRITVSAVSNLKVTLQDMAGAIVKQSEMANGVIVMNTSDLTAGIYMLTVIADNKPVSTQKVIKTE